MMKLKRKQVMLVIVALVLAIAACTCNTSGGVTTGGTTGGTTTGGTTTGGTTGGSGTGAVSVVNNSSVEICYLYISPSTDETWGDDRLGSDTIPAGESFEVTGLAAGNYDFRAEDCSENVIDEEREMAVNEGATTTWTFTDN